MCGESIKMLNVCGKMPRKVRLEKNGVHQSMNGQFTFKYFIFREIRKIPSVVQIFLVLYLSSLCFPCLEKVITKFSVFLVPWPPCLLQTRDMNAMSLTLQWDSLIFGSWIRACDYLPLFVVVVVVLGDRFCRFGGEQGEVGGSMLHWLLLVLAAGWVGAHGAWAAWIGLAPAGLRRKSYLQATTGLVEASPPPRGFGSEIQRIDFSSTYNWIT